MIDYFLIGLKSMMKSSVLTFAIYFISFLLLLILWRIIPLNNIKKIEVDFIPSVKLNGARYFLCIEQKSGKALAYFFGQSKENDKLVRNLKNETKKYHIKVIINW